MESARVSEWGEAHGAVLVTSVRVEMRAASQLGLAAGRPLIADRQDSARVDVRLVHAAYRSARQLNCSMNQNALAGPRLLHLHVFVPSCIVLLFIVSLLYPVDNCWGHTYASSDTIRYSVFA